MEDSKLGQWTRALREDNPFVLADRRMDPEECCREPDISNDRKREIKGNWPVGRGFIVVKAEERNRC